MTTIKNNSWLNLVAVEFSLSMRTVHLFLQVYGLSPKRNILAGLEGRKEERVWVVASYNFIF